MSRNARPVVLARMYPARVCRCPGRVAAAPTALFPPLWANGFAVPLLVKARDATPLRCWAVDRATDVNPPPLTQFPALASNSASSADRALRAAVNWNTLRRFGTVGSDVTASVGVGGGVIETVNAADDAHGLYQGARLKSWAAAT